jgi:hypothetical protein
MIISSENRINKLHGKYINKTITPQELKRLIELTMTRNNHVSVKEVASTFRT